MTWVLLVGAIVSEVTATVALRAASDGRRAWYAVVGAGYLAAIGLLSLTLDAGLDLGVAYGIWAAAGVALTALASRWLFGERLTPVMLAGIGLIVAGVLMIELGAAR